MNRTQSFFELIDLGISAEDATELLDAIARERCPVRPQHREPNPSPHQPVWALMDRPFGISKGFQILSAAETSETFDLDAWEGTLK